MLYTLFLLLSFCMFCFYFMCTFLCLFSLGQLDEDDDKTPTEHKTLKESLITVQTEVKQGVQKVSSSVKPVLNTVQTGMKSGVHSVSAGLKTGVHGMQTGVKAGVQSVSNLWTAFRNRKSEQQTENNQQQQQQES